MWRLVDHGLVESFDHGYGLNPERAGILQRLVENAKVMPGALAGDFSSFGAAKFVVAPIGTTEATPDGPYLAVAQFRHTPQDVVAVTVRRLSGRWQVVALTSANPD